MDAIKARLNVAAEQIQEVKRKKEVEENNYRLYVALQAIHEATNLLNKLVDGLNGSTPPRGQSNERFPMKVIWERPRRNQRFEGLLLESGKIRLSDGRGPYSPSGACNALAKGNFNGWVLWKYWEAGLNEWRTIWELREAGEFV